MKIRRDTTLPDRPWWRLVDQLGTVVHGLRDECAGCGQPFGLTDGQTIDHRTTVQAVYDYEGSGRWALLHRGCGT